MPLSLLRCCRSYARPPPQLRLLRSDAVLWRPLQGQPRSGRRWWRCTTTLILRCLLRSLRSPLSLSPQPPLPRLAFLLCRVSQSIANSLVDMKNQDHVELLLKYLEDGDLRQWRFISFNIGISEWRSKLNCITNPHMYEQLLEMKIEELIAQGNSYISTQKEAAKEFLGKAFKLQLGRGLYGECLGVRADSNPELSDEIGRELSLRSAAAGLRSLRL